MKIIIFKTEDGIAILSPYATTITRIVALLMQQDSKLSKENGLEVAMKTIAEKDVPRILPPDKQELKDKGLMSLKEYLTFPIREYKVIDSGDLAPDFQNFKGARKYDLTLDVPKAREIHKDRLRLDRVALFAANDVVINEGLLYGDNKKIDAGKLEKERLQNIPQLVDAAQTIEEIKAITCDAN